MKAVSIKATPCIVFAMLCLSALLLSSCLSTEQAAALEDPAPDIAPLAATMDDVPDSPQNRDMRYLYEQMIATYPFLPMLKRAGIDWEERARNRLSRDYSDYGIHSDIFRKTLEGLIAGVGGPYGHGSILSTYEYSLIGGSCLFDPSLPDSSWKRAFAFDPEGPYGDAMIRARSDTGAVLGPMALIMEDREEYLYLNAKSFMIGPAQMDEWAERVHAFYPAASMAGKPVIIDIRGNGGGYGGAVRRLVAPLLEERLEASFRILYRDSPLTREWGENLESKTIRELIGPVAHPEDLASFDRLICLPIYQEPFPDLDPVPHGPIYIIQDKGCFSAADGLLAWAKATGFATLVGAENSRGDGILLSPLYFKLPNSGFVVSLSWSSGLNPDGTYNVEVGTAPDIRIGKDEDPIEACLKDFREKAASDR